MMKYDAENDIYVLSRLHLVLLNLHGNLSLSALCEQEAAQMWAVLYSMDSILDRLLRHFVDGDTIYD